MQAVVCPRYGSPDVLRVADLEKPAAEDNEVLVKVHAASLNALDWRRMRGAPFVVRLIEGIRKPKRPRLGTDMAGTVEALGKGATEFHVGDEVFGVAYGAFAEYVSAAEREIALKPSNVSFESAATAGVAAFTALQALRDKGQVRAGTKLLINGAGGGVGTFAIQIAKSLGAEVRAMTRQANLEMVRSIGADHVLDYAKEDFAAGGRQFDVILDIHPRRSISQYKQALTPGGTAITVGFGGLSQLLAIALRAKLTSKGTGRRVVFHVAKPNKKDFEILAGLLRDGKVVPVIDRRYSLDQVADAVRHLESESASGKIVLTLIGDGRPA